MNNNDNMHRCFANQIIHPSLTRDAQNKAKFIITFPKL